MAKTPMLDALAVLGRELARRRLKTHVDLARKTYAAFQRLQKESPWTEEHVEKLMGLLRLPPYQKRYPVFPGSHVCVTCGPGPLNFIAIQLEERQVTTCRGCGGSWLVIQKA